MFHPVIVTVWFSSICLVCRIYSSSSTHSTHLNPWNYSVIYQTSTTRFEPRNIIPISSNLSSSRKTSLHSVKTSSSNSIVLSGDVESNLNSLLSQYVNSKYQISRQVIVLQHLSSSFLIRKILRHCTILSVSCRLPNSHHFHVGMIFLIQEVSTIHAYNLSDLWLIAIYLSWDNANPTNLYHIPYTGWFILLTSFPLQHILLFVMSQCPIRPLGHLPISYFLNT